MIDPAVLGAEGRLVKCSKCDNTWVETQPEDSSAEAPAPVDALEDAPEPEAAPEEAVESGSEFDAVPEETSEEVADDAPAQEDDVDETPEAEPVDDFEQETDPFDAVAARRARHARPDVAARGSEKRSRAGAVMWTLLVITIVGALGAGFALRDTVIQMWPAAEQIYEMVGLEREPPGVGFDIRKVESRTFDRDGKKVLAVKGEIANISKDVRQVPRMQGQLFDKDKKELQKWTFTVPENKLLPGENVTFTTELTNPAEDAVELKVKFTDRW